MQQHQKILFLICLFILFSIKSFAQPGACSPNSPIHIVDLSSNPDSIWTSANLDRTLKNCCGRPNNEPCVKFKVTLHPDADGIVFKIIAGATPPIIEYQIMDSANTICDVPPFPADLLVCLNGVGPHYVVFCKPGNNQNIYQIQSIQETEVSSDITVSEGCQDTIFATGYNESTINWTSVFPGAPGAYDGYLSCTSNCDTAVVTASPGYPPFVDYELSGSPIAGCVIDTIKDTVRVFFVSTLDVAIDPAEPAICFPGMPIGLSAIGSGGALPYSYLWSNGDTTLSTIVTDSGTYWVQIMDSTNCGLAYDTVYVTRFFSAITAYAGLDQTVCADAPTVTLNGIVTVASGGVWSGGAGIFLPDSTDLGATYTPSAAEIALGTVTLTLTTTGNLTCAAVSDSMVINITPLDDPSFTYSASAYCQNDADPTPIITGLPGGTFTAPAAVSINAATGTIDLSASTIGGPYTITYTTAGPCPNATTFDVTINAEDNPAFTYGSANYCQNDADPTPVITGTPGGIFTAPAAVSINAATGTIDLSASTAGGPYTVTYTTPGPTCPNSTIFDVTINEEDDPAFTYGSASYCQNDADPTPIITGTPGGTFTAPGGVSINAGTGIINLSASIIGGPYTITYTTPGPACPNSTTFDVTINAEDDPAFTYGSANYCQNDADPTPVITGTPAGTFTAPAAVSINAATGTIDLSASTTGGPYTVTYTTPGPTCPNSTTFDVTINTEDDPAFTYGSASYCQNDADPTPVVTGTLGGTFTAPAAVSINAATGTIDLSASTTGGPYTVTYTTPGPTCPNSTTFDVTINPEDDPSFGYAAVSYCQNDADPTPVITGTPGGSFSAPAALIINAGTGLIDVSASTVGGPYTVTYTTPGPTCPNSTTFDVTINPEDDPAFTYGFASYCQNDTDPTPVITGTLGGTFTAPAAVSINAATGTIDLSVSTIGGPYTITYTTPGPACQNSATFDVSILLEDDPSFTYSAANYCQGDADPTPIITGTPGGIFTAPAALIINAGTGLIDVSASTVGGPYTVTYTTPGPTCPNSTTFDVTINAEDDPAFTYGSVSYCQNDADPTPVITGTLGGTFTAPAAVSINAATGTIDLSASTVGGPYTITYTTPGPACQNSATFNVTIVIQDDPSFTYSSATFCITGADPTPIITGLPGGVFSEASGNITFISTATGEIDISASTIGGPYNVQYLTNGPCPDSITVPITITVGFDAEFTYPGTPFCEQAANMFPTFTTGSAGTFSSAPAGVNFVNVNTGEINLTTSTPGSYRIYNTIAAAGGCVAAIDSFDIVITPIDDPSFTYGSASYCKDDANPTPVITGLPGGIFTAPAAVSINAGTGQINLFASTIGGPYTVTYTTIGSCPNSTTFDVSILVEDDPTFTYGAATYCQADADPTPVITGTSGGTFTAPASVSINAATGEIDLSSSTVGGPYTITYTTPGLACPNSTTFDVSILLEDDPSFSYGANSYCQGGADPTPVITGTLGGTFTAPAAVSINAATGEIDVSASTPGGPYTITYTTPGPDCPNSAIFNINIILDDPSFTYGSASYCQGDANPIPVISGTPGGSFSAPAAVSINISTGEINLSASTAGGPYGITYTTGVLCPIGSTFFVTIVAEDDPSFSYTSGSFCQAEADPLPLITGTPGGVFSAPVSLVIDTTTGVIDVSASTIGGPYTVTYTTAGTCPNSANFNISISDSMIVDAGVDATICMNSPTVTLSGIAPSTAQWTSSGTGTFSPHDSLLTATYTASSADSTVGMVKLTLTSTNNGNCPAGVDSMFIFINPGIYVDAGASQTVCGDTSSISLSGNVIYANGGQWSTPNGGGSFSPNDSLLTASYIPAIGDTALGSVMIILTSTGNGLCAAVKDTTYIIFTPIPTVNAGPDLGVCATNPIIAMSGNVGGATTTGQWTTTGTGTFTPNDSLLTATYTASNADTTAGMVELILTSTNNGQCQSVSDTLELIISNGITVNAGVNDTVCKNNSTLVLAGVVSGASTTGIWTTAGTGSFSPNDSDLTATYLPSVADIAGDSIYLTLTSTNNGGCLIEKDSMLITYSPSPLVVSGSNQSVCWSNPNVSLVGSVSGGSTDGRWSTSGTGFFVPNDSSLIATYIPSVLDSAAGTITLYLTSINHGNCLPETDSLIVTIGPVPIVSAGPDLLACNDDSVLVIGSVISAAGTGQWSTSGTGSFSPNDSALTVTYIPSSADTLAGSLQLILVSTNNGGCVAVYDTTSLTFTPRPTVTIDSLDLGVCGNNANINVYGSVSGSTTTGQWLSSGTGTFMPSDSALSATYVPSAADIAIGSVLITLQSTNACIESDTVTASITPSPIVDAGVDQFICIDDTAAFLSGSVTGITTTGVWTTSGSGTFLPHDSLLTATYLLSAADSIAGIFELILTSTNNGFCNPNSDTMVVTLTTVPIVDAGPPDTACINVLVSLTGSVAGGSLTGVWSTSGSGSFIPDSTDLNASYQFGPLDTAGSSIQLILTSTNACVVDVDTMFLQANPAPIVDAGSNVSVCSNNVDVFLNGSVSGITTTGQWSTTGTGAFTPNDSTLNATYIPDASDILASTVNLILSSTNNGNCNPVIDTLTVTIGDPATVDGGPDPIICVGDTSIGIIGSISGITTTGQWTTLGSGYFLPNDSTLNATYVMSPADTTVGTVTLILTSTNNGGCLALSDTITLTTTTIPVVSAGFDQTGCSNVPIVLIGSVTGGSTTGVWSTLGSGSFSDSTNLTTVYTFGAVEIAAGSVQLILTSTGACVDITDTVDLTINPAAIVNAGFDQTVCENNSTVALIGSVSGITNDGIWTTSGSGAFVPNDTVLVTNYIPSSADKINGSVTIYLSSRNNQNCNSTVDSMLITITPSPSVDAGNDQFICVGDLANLNGIITGGSSTGIWTTSGTGSFTPNDSDLTAQYVPSSADTALGIVSIVLTSTNNGNCLLGNDSFALTITSLPIVDAGIGDTLCANNGSVTLNGTITGGAVSGIWTTSGTGIFSPDDTTLNATYIPSLADGDSGSVTLTLTSIYSCAISDSVLIIYTPRPVVESGPNPFVCIYNPTVSLVGNISGGSNTGIWSTLGDGIFSPNDSTLTGTYDPGIADTTSGSVILILTSTNNGDCLAENDSITVNIVPPPIVYAGVDDTVCANVDIQLTGSITVGAIEGYWTSTGSGTFVPDSSDLNAQYIISSADSLAGSVSFYLTPINFSGCPITYDTVDYIITPAPYADGGPDLYVCANNDTVSVFGQIFGPTNTGIWETYGSGNFLFNDTILSNQYDPDTADISNGFVVLSLTTTNNGNCNAETYLTLVNIIQAPVIDLGPDLVACNDDNISLSPTLSGGSTGISWSTLGTGFFTPSDSAVNAVYHPGGADTLAGFVTLIGTSKDTSNCYSVNDSLQIQFTVRPIVLAGSNDTVCANNSDVILNGSVSGSSTTGIWITSGTGVFVPSDTALSATYQPSIADIDSGYVNLTLASTNSCLETDFIEIYITPAPTVDAGIDQYLCVGDTSAILVGNVSSGSTTGLWTTLGSGSFSPNDSTLTATYFMSAADTAAHNMTLILASTNNNLCLPVYDTLNIYLTTVPSVDAGVDDTVCQNVPINLAGTIIGGSGTGVWTTLGTGAFVDSTQLNTNYIISQNDANMGVVKLVLTSTNACQIISDTVEFIVLPKPELTITLDNPVCINNLMVNLTGTVANAGGLQWSSLGGGVFSPNDSINATTYLGVPGDSSAGQVTIILTSTNNGICNAVTTSQNIIFTDIPIVDAGGNQTVCKTNIIVNLSGSVTGSSSTGQWSSLGGGSFVPNDSSLTPIYIPSSADTTAGSVTLVLSSINNGTCLPVTDTMLINFIDGISVDLGFDDTLCSSLDSIALSGIINGPATSLVWTTTGSGIFVPNDTVLTATYLPDTADLTNGSVTLILTALPSCALASDSLTVTFMPVPNANYSFLTTCNDSVVIFNNLSSISTGSIVDYEWNFGDGGSDTIANPVHIYSPPSSYSVGLVVESDQGCRDSINKTVNIRAIQANFTYSTPCLTDFVDFIETSYAQNDTIVDWLWDFGDGGSSSFQNPTYTYSSDQPFNVLLIVTTAGNCIDTFDLEISGECPGEPAIPSAFSPNGDGANDVLLVDGGPFEEFLFKIYNGWGEVIYESDDQEEGWDGRKKNVNQPMGVYVYNVVLTTYDGKEIQFSGSVTLLR